jgi:hypothetical protein
MTIRLAATVDRPEIPNYVNRRGIEGLPSECTTVRAMGGPAYRLEAQKLTSGANEDKLDKEQTNQMASIMIQ